MTTQTSVEFMQTSVSLKCPKLVSESKKQIETYGDSLYSLRCTHEITRSHLNESRVGTSEDVSKYDIHMRRINTT